LDPKTQILTISVSTAGPEARAQHSVSLFRPRSSAGQGSRVVPNPPPVISNIRYKIEDDHLAIATGAGESPQGSLPRALYHPDPQQVAAAHALVGKIAARVREKIIPVAVKLMDGEPDALQEGPAP